MRLWLDTDLELEPRALKPLTRVSDGDHGEMFSSWLWQSDSALDAEGLRGWLQALPSDVFRVKGLVRAGAGQQGALVATRRHAQSVFAGHRSGQCHDTPGVHRASGF